MEIKKRFERILSLYFYLQSRSFSSLKDLVTKYAVSERTIFRDLKSLEAAGVPVLNESGRGYSVMDGFRIYPPRFSEEEVLSLIVAEKFIQDTDAQIIKKHFNEALNKIKSSFRSQQKHTSFLLENKLQIDKAASGKEYKPDVLDVILKSVLKKEKAEILYLKKGSEHPEKRRIEVIGVFHQSSHWYVLAFCHLRADYRHFRIDRIQSVCLSSEPFDREHPDLYTIRQQEKDQQSITDIRVRIEKRYAHYMHWERHQMGFTEETEADGYYLMDFNCKHSPEYFIRWFMPYADIADILYPAELKVNLASSLEKAYLRSKSS